METAAPRGAPAQERASARDLAANPTSCARRRWEQAKISQAHKVAWLVEVVQAKHSHHTGLNYFSSAMDLVAEVQSLKQEVKELRSFLAYHQEARKAAQAKGVRLINPAAWRSARQTLLGSA